MSVCLNRWDASLRRRHLAAGDVVLLFDLNGTLTSHTSQRRSSGQNSLRPGTEHLMKLKVRDLLCLHVTSTACSSRNVFGLASSALRRPAPWIQFCPCSDRIWVNTSSIRSSFSAEITHGPSAEVRLVAHSRLAGHTCLHGIRSSAVLRSETVGHC